MSKLIGLFFLLIVFLLVFAAVMFILASPILLLLHLAGDQRLKKIRYKFGGHEQIIKRNINQNHSFYLSLDQAQKKEFIWRIYYFLNTTDFVIKFQGDKTKIKMTISFVAAQISYALPIQSFDLYHRVIVYEDDYYSQINQHYHKGEVNPGTGIMVFSWNAIQYGLSKSNDGLNLLVHEFAHALRLEHKLMSYNIFDEEQFDYMDNLLDSEYEKELMTDSALFRPYATTNIEEFFAVASEFFFERSAALQAHKPELHQAFKLLYKQNPQS
jgi:Mlc titration factor MtfA (ptsG expression regulator)